MGISDTKQPCQCGVLSYPESFTFRTFQLLSLLCFPGKDFVFIEMMTPHGTALRWRAGSNAFNAAGTQLMKLWVSHIIPCGKWCTLNDVLPVLQRCLLKRKWAVSSLSCHLALSSTPRNFTCHTFPLLSSLSLFLSLPNASHSLLFLFLSLLSCASLDKILSPFGYINILYS